MAPNATNHTPGRTARAIHWLLPSRQLVVLSLVADIGLVVLRLPVWVHLLLIVVPHLLVHLAGRRPE